MRDFVLLILEFMTTRFFFLVPMFVGLAAWWYTNIWMDKSAGIKFGDVWQEIKSGNQVVGDYRGRRAIAVAIVIAGVSIAGAIAAKL